jgi:transcriptional regulator with XRE-family HTH domain
MINIKELIAKSGVTQASLAKKLGISRQQLFSILKADRKTKYSKQIVNILNHELMHKESNPFRDITSPVITNNYIEKLPIIYPEDVLRIMNGTLGLSSLNKPFYNQWSFIKNNEPSNNLFCLRITDNLNFKCDVALGSFQLYITLQQENDKYLLIYLTNSKKIVMGYVEINPDTKEKYIISNHINYPISKEDVILAQCTQIVLYW